MGAGVPSGLWHKGDKSVGCCCLWLELVPFLNGSGEEWKLPVLFSKLMFTITLVAVDVYLYMVCVCTHQPAYTSTCVLKHQHVCLRISLCTYTSTTTKGMVNILVNIHDLLWCAGEVILRHCSPGNGEGRCAWHWQEHRGGCAGMQQLQVGALFVTHSLRLCFHSFGLNFRTCSSLSLSSNL